MSNTDQLFDVPEQLSPRLAWMKKHNVITYRCPSDGLWVADFCEDGNEDFKDPYSYFAKETAMNGDHYIGLGQSEDEAITHLCIRCRVKLWNEENS